MGGLMCTQEATNNRKLIINPEFKKQLLLLKRNANAELNIQISLDKMASDKHYRLTVLSELDGLGSDVLNTLVTQLKHTPVYIKIITTTIAVNELPAPKKSRLSLMLMSLLIIIVIAGFISWQNGYIRVGNGESRLLNNQAISANLIKETVSVDNATYVPALVATSVINSLDIITPDVDAAMAKKELILPSQHRSITLRLHGSNTVGENLAPALLEAYLRDKQVTQMKWMKAGVSVERELQYIQNDQVYAIQLHAHGSSTGFNDLLTGDADMSMSSRKIKPEEIDALKPMLGNLASSGQEYIIGLDGLAIIVNKNNPLMSITNEILAKIFSGEIVNWKQLGGQDLAINLYARDNNSGTWDTFNSLVLKANKKQLMESSERIESSNELSQRVADDIAAIGFIGLPYINNSKALAISATLDSAVIYPTRFTVSTEDYILSRRLYMYASNRGNKMAQEFIQFVISQPGQNVVESVGLVSQNIKLETAYTVKNAPQNYNNYADIASRLSVSFRFKSGSNEFDNKAKRDIKRLVDYLSLHTGRRIVLMGFSDSTGDPEMNASLSLVRATRLEKKLNAYGLNITAVEGFGAQLPIASNKSAIGRSKNRRVEVWVF